MKSWNEIRKAATAFSKRWKDAYDEKSQAQSFLKEFFAVFGVDAVTVATFEHRVKFADGSQGYVDCFWLGTILVEMKSRCRDLDAAFRQAMDYVRSLPDTAQTPRAIVVSDFARVRFYDLANDCAGYWKLDSGSQAAQSVFEISVDGMTYFEHDSEGQDVEVNPDVNR